MFFPATTALFAAIFALVYVALSAWVIGGRLTSDVLHGDGGDEALQKRIRAHGNFAEYVPLTLVVIGLLEAAGGRHWLVLTLLIVLLVARLAHPVGMFTAKNSPLQFAFRGGGIISTLTVMAVAAIALLIRLP